MDLSPPVYRTERRRCLASVRQLVSGLTLYSSSEAAVVQWDTWLQEFQLCCSWTHWLRAHLLDIWILMVIFASHCHRKWECSELCRLDKQIVPGVSWLHLHVIQRIEKMYFLFWILNYTRNVKTCFDPINLFYSIFLNRFYSVMSISTTHGQIWCRVSEINEVLPSYGWYRALVLNLRVGPSKRSNLMSHRKKISAAQS